MYLGGFDVSCQDLIKSYTPLQELITDILIECTNGVRFNFGEGYYYHSEGCNGFGLNFVDTDFGIDGNRLLRYTSSYFYTATESEWRDLYNIRGDFDTGNAALIDGVYDTTYGDFNEKYTEEVMIMDVVSLQVSRLLCFVVGLFDHRLFLHWSCCLHSYMLRCPVSLHF